MSVTYIAPALTATMPTVDQAYHLGVWTFIIFILSGAMAVYAVMAIDYSEDTLLTVDVEHDASKDE